MTPWTAQQLINKLDTELDMTDDTFISVSERYDYINEAIAKAERIVHSIHLDYFKKSGFVSLVQGQQKYPMPADCYMTYIRDIWFSDSGFPATGSNCYEVRMIKPREIPLVQTSDDYMFDIENDSPVATGQPTTGLQFVVYPVPRETTSTKMQWWYIRHAASVAVGGDLIDIPEGHTYIYHYCKTKWLSKDKGNPAIADAENQLKAEEQSFRDSLRAMAPRGKTEELDMDMEFYEEML